MANTSAYMVASLLEKMTSSDTDFRYMATNDLTNELQKDSFQLEESTEKKVVAAVLKLLDDKNGEVQNLAIKCLGPLVKKLHEAQLQEIVDELCGFTVQKREEKRDIGSIGLKTVIVEIPSNSTVALNICQRLIPRLISQLDNNTIYEIQLDTLDVMIEVLSRFGILLVANPQLQSSIQNALILLLNHSRPAIRKRATVAIGNLVVNIGDDLFNELVQKLLVELKRTENSHDKSKTLIYCVGTVSRFSAQRLGKYLEEILPIVIVYAKEEDDELREYCLQALESLVLRCPTEITRYIPTIIDLCLEYIKYDPNFEDPDDDDEADENAMDEDEDEDEEDEFDDEFSDDDDISWKVRRSASKVFSAIISTRHELLPKLYETVAPALIARFKEREETVRVDILQTFITLLRQTIVYAKDEQEAQDADDIVFEAKRRKLHNPMDTDDSMPQLLRQQVPKLAKSLSKQLTSKSIQTRQTGFVLLRELITVLRGGLDYQISLFIPAISSSLAGSETTIASQSSGTSSNLKIEVLSFLRQLFRTHPPHVFNSHLERLAPPIIASVNDKFYKIPSEALLVCNELIKVIRPIVYIPSTDSYNLSPLGENSKSYIQQICKATLARLFTSDADQEVKERSITCLGVLLSQTGDELKPELKECMPLLLERLKNEITRLTTVKAFTMIAESPVIGNEDTKDVILEAISEVALLLRKNNRQIKASSLICLKALLKRYGEYVNSETFTSVLVELRPLLSDSDLHLLPLALSTLGVVLEVNPGSLVQVKEDILESLLNLVKSPLIQGTSLDSLLKIYATLVRTDERDFTPLMNSLMNLVRTDGEHEQPSATTQSHSIIAQCAATLCLNSPSNCQATVNTFINEINNPSSSDSLKCFSLLALGEIGRKIDLSQNEELHSLILSLFSSQLEEIKSAAAFALGNVAVGNVPKYLPIIIDEIKGQSKKQYLLFHSLKELITRHSHQQDAEVLKQFNTEIWELLFANCDTQEEGTRNVVAECIGKMTLTSPQRFLPDLKAQLQSASPHTRGTVVTAIRYTFTDQTQSFDDLLHPLIVEFLSLMHDGDLNVRKMSLSTLNSAAHNKPYLIRDVLDQLLPLLYEETVVRDNLIHTVEMGPFKHKVDEGLEIRKAAFECMYTLLDHCLDRIEIFGFLERVVMGLSDQQDIKVLAHLMLIRLARVLPAAVAQKLDDCVDPLKATIEHKIKQSSVKQEVEKHQELVRSALRAVAVISKLSEASSSPKFVGFLSELKSGALAEEYQTVLQEMDAKESYLNGGLGEFMDLS
ncbi:Cullin-associated NEDD8-dissociated protein 1 [Basidiobolus meristosporus CBS 931.73]|uniref:Cullin-associated NEDD8-dissociated protein 1 n=1 Tax=Basidiobolus meristosporus CBS 931.73 TaxID=1314790 RepID=A0A1Y1XZV7_9FUNG|nr:Cullin-associated NEDD8-dissociated protein 1 [Basidiobolus meristosporus CBS 931.73]|eukprot:ORX91195.1 Cullin-associated NEDD8-dissociated protein 1 [Basidiobolus meristosporus CBS 931.73]